MKIVHAVEATATGTLAMVALCANLSLSRGHEVIVLYSRRPETPKDLENKFLADVKLQELNLSGFHSLLSFVKLRKFFKDANPDVVHLHSSFAGFIGRLALATISFSPKVFYSPHCISFMRKDIHLKKYLFAALEILASVKRSTYLACSNSEKSAIRRWIFRPSLVLENAVESRRNSSDESSRPLSHHPLRVVTVGGIRPQKGPKEFLKIFHEAKLNRLPVEFTWIGDGEIELRNQLESAGIRVTGWLDSQGVLRELANSDLYLSTSRWEGMPISILEAMRNGILVLASNSTGNVDVISNGRTGFIFNTIDQAVARMAEISLNEELYSELRDAARKQILTRFSQAHFDTNLHRIYSDPSC